jgi:hypothetical protein
MTLEEAITERDRIESEILHFVRQKVSEFTNKTGLDVNSIKIDMAEHIAHGDRKPQHSISDCTVSVEL